MSCYSSSPLGHGLVSIYLFQLSELVLLSTVQIQLGFQKGKQDAFFYPFRCCWVTASELIYIT